MEHRFGLHSRPRRSNMRKLTQASLRSASVAQLSSHFALWRKKAARSKALSSFTLRYIPAATSLSGMWHPSPGGRGVPRNQVRLRSMPAPTKGLEVDRGSPSGHLGRYCEFWFALDAAAPHPIHCHLDVFAYTATPPDGSGRSPPMSENPSWSLHFG